MKNTHWYDGMNLDDLNHLHVRITLKNGVVVYGDLEVRADQWDGDGIGVSLNNSGWQMMAFVVTADGTRLRDEVKSVDCMWDGKIWRKRTENDSGNSDAILVNDRVYTVDSEEYDEDNRTFYEIVKQSNGHGSMLRKRFPVEAVTERLMLIDGDPDEPGIYKGADGSLWGMTRLHEYWQIIPPDYNIYDRDRGDIPAEAFPLEIIRNL